MNKARCQRWDGATLLFKGGIIPLVASAACFCFKASALGIRVLGQDAEAMARGDAFVATADNPSAIYYNPAGMTQLHGNRLQIGGGLSWWDREETSKYTGQEVEAKDTFQAAPQFYYSFSPEQKSMPSIGVGLYSPYGFSADWPVFNPADSLRNWGHLEYYVLNPALALPIGETLSVGAGAQIAYSKLSENSALRDPGGLIIEDHEHGTGMGYGYNLGVLWHPSPKHSIGIAYHSSTSIDYDVHVTSIFGDLPNVPPQTSSVTHKVPLRFPRNVVGGYSYQPSEKWNFEFDLDWTDWDEARPANWRSDFIYKIGATRKFVNGWHVSGGYAFAENSVPDSRFNRIIPDANEHLFSVGCGKSFGVCDITLAYRLTYCEPRSLSGSSGNGNYLLSGINGAVLQDSVVGKYESIGHMLALSLGFRF